jgi:hypothetical protein
MIAEVGSPRVDCLRGAVATGSHRVNEIRASLGLPEGARVILFPEGIRAMDQATIVRAVQVLSEVVGLDSDIYVIIKPHPAEDALVVERVIRAAAAGPLPRVYVRQMELEDAIICSDLVLCLGSTVGIEAAAAGAHVARLDVQATGTRAKDEPDGMPVVRDAGDLVRFLDNPRTVSAGYLHDQFSENLGRSRERFFEELFKSTESARLEPDEEVRGLLRVCGCESCSLAHRLSLRAERAARFVARKVVRAGRRSLPGEHRD